MFLLGKFHNQKHLVKPLNGLVSYLFKCQVSNCITFCDIWDIGRSFVFSFIIAKSYLSLLLHIRALYKIVLSILIITNKAMEFVRNPPRDPQTTSLFHPSLGWLYVFSSFPPPRPRPPPPQWPLLLMSKPFELDLRYLGQRKYRSRKLYWITFWWPWPKVTAVTLKNKKLLICKIKWEPLN